jgi:hypothetical protein
MSDEAIPQIHFGRGMVIILVTVVAAILVGVWVYQGLDLSGARARKTADDIRELNNEMDATNRSMDPHCCGWKPHWEASGITTNGIDGTKTEFLTTESTDPEGADSGSLRYAEMKICFENGKLCGGNDIGIGIDVHEMVAPLEDSEYRTSVRLRFDDGKPIRQTWGISDGHDALFPIGREQQFLADLTQHSKLVLEFSYFEKAPRTVTFDLSGLAEKMKSESLRMDSAREQTK